MSFVPGDKTEKLVKRAQAGDRAAFDDLVRRYRARIYALTLHLTGSRSEADDITQDVFTKAYQQLASFAGRSEFFTWLYRIAVNRALNARRDTARRRSSGRRTRGWWRRSIDCRLRCARPWCWWRCKGSGTTKRRRCWGARRARW